MMLRASTQMMLCPSDTNEKILKAELSGFFGGATRNRTGDRGVADLCLTAWPWRHIWNVNIISRVGRFVNAFLQNLFLFFEAGNG